jgi:hypothetical protein
MPKSKNSLPPRFSGPCPNPNCTSRTRIFQNLQKHLAQKQDCLAFLQLLRKDVLTKSAALEQAELDQSKLTYLQNQTSTNDGPTETGPIDDSFILLDDATMADMIHGVADAYMDDNNPAAAMLPNDFEQTNFNNYIGPDESQYLVNPNQTVFTNARRVEVTLLKILTELEAPLWAFKVLMEWALDAAQSGYKFIPQQASYQSQVETICKWVGMEHMHPTEVIVPLPGIRPGDTVPVTTFDFVSQLHSLLSDKELNNTENLVINKDNPFTRYIPPDGRLGECLSGSWYNHAWDHMEQSTDSTL